MVKQGNQNVIVWLQVTTRLQVEVVKSGVCSGVRVARVPIGLVAKLASNSPQSDLSGPPVLETRSDEREVAAPAGCF